MVGLNLAAQHYLLYGYIIHYKRASYFIVKTDLSPPTYLLWECNLCRIKTGKRKDGERERE